MESTHFARLQCIAVATDYKVHSRNGILCTLRGWLRCKIGHLHDIQLDLLKEKNGFLWTEPNPLVSTFYLT